MRTQRFFTPWLVSMLVAAAIAPQAFAQAAVIESEFIYEAAPFPKLPRRPRSSRRQDGLVARLVRRDGGRPARRGHLGFAAGEQALDAARGSRHRLGLRGESLPTWNPVLFQPQRAAHALLQGRSEPEQMVGNVEDQHRPGQDVESRPAVCRKASWARSRTSPCSWPTATIFCPASTEDAGWRVHFERSADGGQTWSETGPVNDGKSIAAIQPSIFFLGGDKLLAIGRTRQGKIFRIASDDAGQTWGQMKLTDLPNPNSGIDAVTLEKRPPPAGLQPHRQGAGRR